MKQREPHAATAKDDDALLDRKTSAELGGLRCFAEARDAGKGQPLKCYNTMYGGPSSARRSDGREEWHVECSTIIERKLRRRRSKRDALHCIRCGSVR